MKTHFKTYIGDSVYAAYDEGGRVILTTENGLLTDPSNTIILEPEVMIALARFYESATDAWVRLQREKMNPTAGTADSTGHGQPT